MRQAKVNGSLVEAGPNCPGVAECPACGGEVRKRKRKVGKNDVVYFFRHRAGVEIGCPLRYRPTS